MNLDISSQNVNYANSADRAVSDKHGNDIADSYIKKNDLLDSIYPVGAIYMSVSSANPGTLFGGTWVEWGSGRVPVGVSSTETEFDNSEKTGGEKSHTLSSTEMPSHSHTFTGTSHAHTLNGHSHSIPSLGVIVGTNGAHSHNPVNGTLRGFMGYIKNSTFGRNRITVGSGTKYTFAADTNTDLTYEETTASAGDHSHTASTAAGTTGTNSNNTSGITAGGTNSSTGGSGAHNNLQPYITCYMWKRTD